MTSSDVECPLVTVDIFAELQDGRAEVPGSTRRKRSRHQYMDDSHRDGQVSCVFKHSLIENDENLRIFLETFHGRDDNTFKNVSSSFCVIFA